MRYYRVYRQVVDTDEAPASLAQASVIADDIEEPDLYHLDTLLPPDKWGAYWVTYLDQGVEAPTRGPVYAASEEEQGVEWSLLVNEDGTSAPDPTVWGARTDSYGGGIGYNRAQNVESTTLGGFRLKVVRESYLGYEFTSSILDSRLATGGTRFFPRYGRFEITCKLEHGQGLWPSFWLRHRAGARAVEIDIMEYFHSEVPNKNRMTVWTNANAAMTNEPTKDTIAQTVIDADMANPGWHTYAVEIVPEGDDDEDVRMRFYFDGDLVGQRLYLSPWWLHNYAQHELWDMALDHWVGGNWIGHPDDPLASTRYLSGGYCLIGGTYPNCTTTLDGHTVRRANVSTVAPGTGQPSELLGRVRVWEYIPGAVEPPEPPVVTVLRSWSEQADGVTSNTGTAVSYEWAGSYGQRMVVAQASGDRSHVNFSIPGNPRLQTTISAIFTLSGYASASVPLVNGVDDSGAFTQRWRVGISTTGRVRIWNATGTQLAESPVGQVIPLNQEVRLEIMQDGDTLTARVFPHDSTSRLVDISATIPEQPVNHVRIGNILTTPTLPRMTMDELVITDQAWPVGPPTGEPEEPPTGGEAEPSYPLSTDSLDPVVDHTFTWTQPAATRSYQVELRPQGGATQTLTGTGEGSVIVRANAMSGTAGTWEWRVRLLGGDEEWSSWTSYEVDAADYGTLVMNWSNSSTGATYLVAGTSPTVVANTEVWGATGQHLSFTQAAGAASYVQFLPAVMGGPHSTLGIRGLWTLSALPSAEAHLIHGLEGSEVSNTGKWRVNIAGSAAATPGQIRIRNGANTLVASSTVAPAWTSGIIRLEIIQNGNDITVYAYEGTSLVPVATVTANVGVTGVDHLRWGNMASTPTMPQFFLDEMRVRTRAVRLGHDGWTL